MDWKTKLKKYVNETLTSIGVASILLIFTQMKWKILGFKCEHCGEYVGFEISLLKIYIFTAVSLGLYYYLYPKLIKNFFNRKKLWYVILAIETPFIYVLIDAIFNFIHLQKITINFLVIPLGLVFGGITITIVYFAESAYYKRVNKKLNEYKQKNDDDNTDK